MIEINLLPSAVKRRRRAKVRPSVSLPSLGALANVDRWLAAAVIAWIVAPALVGWMFMDTRERQRELGEAIDQQVADSARYARIIDTTERLRARQDTIAQKLQIIEEIDAGRYVWPHIMDEVSRALPDYTWLNRLYQIEGGATPAFRIEGLTGNNFALTRFMTQLELSPFLRGVRLNSTEQVVEDDKRVFAFVLEARYAVPPADMIEMVSLFSEEG